MEFLENSTTILLTPNTVLQGTTTATSATATTAFTIDGEKGERKHQLKNLQTYVRQEKFVLI